MFTIPLETERFIIRLFQPKDLHAFLDFMMDSNSTKYLAFDEEQKTESGARALFNFVCSSYHSNNPVCSYAIAEKDSDLYVGSCGFAPYDEGICECYYSVNKTERGKGVATEVTKAMVEILSESVEVRAYCHPENYAAHAVAKKASFIHHGQKLHKNFGITGEIFIYKKGRNSTK